MKSERFKHFGYHSLKRKLGVVLLGVTLASCAGDTRPPSGSTLDGAAISAARDPEPSVVTLEARKRVAKSMLVAGDYATALRLYQQVLAENPADDEAFTGMGLVYSAFRAWGEARTCYQRALEINPDNVNAQAGLGQVLVIEGQAGEALKYLQSAAASDERNPQLSKALGIAYDLLGRHEDAQMEYGRGLDLVPGDASLMNNLALSFALSENYPTAIRLLSGLVSGDRMSDVSRQNLATVYALSDDPEAAERLLKLDLEPDQIKSRLYYFKRLRAADRETRTKALFLGVDPPPLMPEIHQTYDETPPVSVAEAPDVLVPESEPAAQAGISATPATPPALASSADVKRYSVQMGSYRSREIALEGWRRLADAQPALLGDYTPALAEANLGEQGIFYRLYVAEIVDFSAAETLCNDLAARQVSCLVRKFPAPSEPDLSGNDNGPSDN